MGNQSDPWTIDAGASLQAVVDRADAPELLRRTLSDALSWQQRVETTVGRALRSSRLAPEWTAALLALGATVTVIGGGGTAEIPLESLLADRRQGDVTALHVPHDEQRWGAARVARTPADAPIVAAIAAVTLDGDVVRSARVALVGAWPETVRLAEPAGQLVGGPLDDAAIDAVAEAMERDVAPEGDFLGSAEYRRAMAGVLTRRALARCIEPEG